MTKTIFKYSLDRKTVKKILIPIISVFLAFLIGMFILLASGKDPLLAYSALFEGAFGDLSAIGDTLSRATPVIFTGLAVAFAFRCGLFNIGVEGQLLMGALAAGFAGYYFKGLPLIVHLPIAILFGAVVGGIWALIPAILKAYRGVHEVITTIMFNYIAYSLTSYAVSVLRDGATPKTPLIKESAILVRFSNFIPGFEGSTLNIGFIFAVLACLVIFFILWKTVLGYEVRAVGLSPLAAQDGGIKIKRNIIYAMLISGVLAGFAGCERVLGIYHFFAPSISPGYGFEGIAVSLLANNHPFGIILSGILFGALSSGGLNMDIAADVPQDIIVIIQGLIILFIGANKIVNLFVYRTKKEEV